ncbi:hypothetical protein ACJJIC_15680 [Microbulbifer sp. ANSA002]|uniref:hypothetical protein n=1 Tax=unclassified Microbulbifer TaxID=2619833 RepID=UPI00404222AA
MKLLVKFLTVLIFAGCSTLSKTINYEIEPTSLLKRTYVFDWCEENQATLGLFEDHCFGIYNPPLYSYPVDKGYLVIYPLLVSHREIAAGPLGLPVIPLGGNNGLESSERKLYFRFRTYSETDDFNVIPLKLIAVSAAGEGCEFSKSSEDDIGEKYTCMLTINQKSIKSLKVNLKLSDNSEVDILYKLSEFTSYRPVVAPNGPARDEKPFIIIEKNDA